MLKGKPALVLEIIKYRTKREGWDVSFGGPWSRTMPCNMTRFTLKPSLPRHWRGQFSHLQQNKGQNTLPIWKMFQDVSRQNKLSGSCAILFGRSWFTSLVRTDSLQTLGNPKLQPGSGLEGSSPSTWAGRNRTYRNLLCLGLMFIKCTDPYGSKLLWLSLQIVWCGLVQIFQMCETTMESTCLVRSCNWLLFCHARERKSLGHQACSLARFPGATLNCKVQGSNHHL